MHFLPFIFSFFSPKFKKIKVFSFDHISHPPPPPFQFCDIKKYREKFKKLAKISQIYSRRKNPKNWARNKVTKMFGGK